ncbi:hypothetical protein [Microcoleus sp. F4-D5]|uniref:hypothetical protein n=1 Tax=Microcoleus sp. F4-D5 TaxID=2818760 RepID=UPI002FCFCD20
MNSQEAHNKPFQRTRLTVRRLTPSLYRCDTSIESVKPSSVRSQVGKQDGSNAFGRCC